MKRKRVYCCALSRTAPLWVVFGWFRRRSVLSALHTDKHGTPLPARTATPKNRADGVAVGCWVRSEGLLVPELAPVYARARAGRLSPISANLRG